MAVYTFSHEKGEPMPYRVKIPTKSVSLRHVKDFLPKKGAFRYYSHPFVLKQSSVRQKLMFSFLPDFTLRLR